MSTSKKRARKPRRALAEVVFTPRYVERNAFDILQSALDVAESPDEAEALLSAAEEERTNECDK